MSSSSPALAASFRVGAIAFAALLFAGCSADDLASPTGEPAFAKGGVSNACANRTNATISNLLQCVTLDGVRAHQAALQAVADANGGTRATGTPGYDASVAYVVSVLEAAGYTVALDPFDFKYIPPSTLEQITPISASYTTGAFAGSGTGGVTAAVTPVDFNLVPPQVNSSGCEAADFAGFPAGNIALMQRGTCTFAIKALNAEAAGASAVIIFNQGNTPERKGLIIGTLSQNAVNIPVVGASYATGVALTEPGTTARVIVPPSVNTTQYNVIAESNKGDPDNVVMVGGHLDSRQEGPGIQDNGSGVAAILETAVQLAKTRSSNKLRFAFWGGEESGLIGSTAYVDGRAQAELDRIALYLNFDMIGSPNHVFFILDGDGSDGFLGGAGPDGSAAIEAVFETYYRERGHPFKGTDFSGRSDYGPFIAKGIPSGGLFTGAEGIKTAAEAALWGGTAGNQYDPCNHEACDTFDNVNLFALETNADAVAYATLTFAMSTKAVNGVRGKRVPRGKPVWAGSANR